MSRDEWNLKQPLDADLGADAETFPYVPPSESAVTRIELPPALAAALVAAQRNAGAVEKGAVNSFHKYRYASAEAMILESRSALSAAGLALIEVEHHTPDVARWQTHEDGRRSVRTTDLDVVYGLVHESGSGALLRARTPVIAESGRPEDKAVATGLTYNLGYMLRSLLLLPRVEEGTDVDQRDDRQYQPAAAARPAPARAEWSKAQLEAVAAAHEKSGLSVEDFRAWIKDRFGVEKLRDTDPAGYPDVMNYLAAVTYDKTEREAIEGDKRSAAASRAVDAVADGLADGSGGGADGAADADVGTTAPAPRRRAASAARAASAPVA